MWANGMLTFIDGTEREQSVQDVLHLHRLVKGGVIQDSTLLWCADELRWLPAIVLDVYRQVKEFIEDEGDKPTGASPWAPTAQPPQPQQPNPQQLIAQMDALVNARKVAAQQAAGRWGAWGLRWK